MFAFLVFTAATAASHGLTWNHADSLIKYSKYTYTHHYELYDAFRLNNTFQYRNKTIELVNTNYSNSDKKNRF